MPTADNRPDNPLLGFSFSRYLLLVLIAQGTLQHTDLEHSCLSFQAPPVS